MSQAFGLQGLEAISWLEVTGTPLAAWHSRIIPLIALQVKQRYSHADCPEHHCCTSMSQAFGLQGLETISWLEVTGTPLAAWHSKVLLWHHKC